VFSFGVQRKFAIGKYDTAYGDGWRRVTAAEWRNPAFQAALVQAHQEGGGWPLLEEPLVCNNRLCVAEGWVRIDGWAVFEVGYIYPSQQLRGVYPAMNYDAKVAWTTTAPALGNTWTIFAWKPSDNPPCLFVQVLRLSLFFHACGVLFEN
jgi:hypothetical protein